MKERILHILEVQDSSKSQFQFLFKGKRNIHFPFGMILSLLINIASLCLSVTLISELIYHSKPTVNYAKFHSSMTRNMTLNTKELLFTIAIRDNNYNLINDPSIGQIIATYEKTTTINGNINIEIINLDFMNCSNVYPLFDKLGVSDRFNSTGLINYNCYNYSEPIIIGGKYGTEFYGNLAFYIAKCRNGSESNIKCKSEEEIDSIIQKGWLQITYVSSYVDFNNYSYPIQYVTEDTYIMFDVTMNKKMYIYFSPLEIHSENNIIFSNKNKKISSKHDVTTTDIISVLDNGIISSIMVCPSFTVEKYYRRYIKIQEIGASIGGFYSGLNIFIILISSFHKKKYTEMKIINELFAFGNEQIIKENHSLFKINPVVKFENIINNENNEFNKSIFNTTKEVMFGKKKIINFNLINKFKRNSNTFIDKKFNKMIYYKIDLGFKNSFKLMLCCFREGIKENYKEYNFVKKELLKYIDYTEVSKYFMDVERIKKILNEFKIADNWVSEKKLIAIDLHENKTECSKIINSTVIANSNIFLAGENKNNEFSGNLKK